MGPAPWIGKEALWQLIVMAVTWRLFGTFRTMFTAGRLPYLLLSPGNELRGRFPLSRRGSTPHSPLARTASVLLPLSGTGPDQSGADGTEREGPGGHLVSAIDRGRKEVLTERRESDMRVSDLDPSSSSRTATVAADIMRPALTAVEPNDHLVRQPAIAS